MTPLPLLLFCCNRPNYLFRTMEAVFARDDEKGRRIIVSQDGSDADVVNVVQSMQLRHGPHVEHWVRNNGPSKAGRRYRIFGPRKKHHRLPHEQVGARIARHYKLSLDQFFFGPANHLEHQAVIVLEDDLEIGVDFFSLMRAGAQWMADDPSIFTVSAFNDHGYQHFVGDPSVLNRTDFFSGLGWLVTRQLWQELSPQWPLIWWDDFLRQPSVTRGRSTIVPEIPRTLHFGDHGSTMTKDVRARFEGMALHTDLEDFQHFETPPPSRAKSRQKLVALIEQAQPVALATYISERNREPNVPFLNTAVIAYDDAGHFDAISLALGLWPFHTLAETPRGALDGVLVLKDRGRTLVIAPKALMNE